MTVRTVLNSIPVEFRAIFDESQLDVESGVSIPVQFRTPTTKRYVTATSHPQLSRQKVVKIAKKSEGVKYLATSVRTVSVGRSLKYPTETNFLLDEVKKGCKSGNPMSRNEIYLRLIQQFGNDGILGPPSEFCSVMKLNGGGISPALAQWVRRRLEGANWSIRKESVSQKVPTDWVLIALVASQKIRTKLDGCTVLINADEVFIKLFPRDTEFVVPTGTKRAGSNVASDAKKGCTVMVSAEIRFATWRDEGGDASVHFQPSHWMDTPTAKKYADFLVSLYTGQKIGLIWDAASAHICQEMIDYLSEKGIMYEKTLCDERCHKPSHPVVSTKLIESK
ncbi:hypothetical protein PInf_004611 [Phytophthora infestans]|nr:hypothetical protein PInf_004611 [Phytophthora infestans]